MWVTIPIADPNNHLATDVKVKIRLAKPYNRHYSSIAIPDTVESAYGQQNNNYPMYNFSTDAVATEFEDETAFDNDLDMIRVVPNPYYAYSTYENVPLDNRVKITNLPDRVITIYRGIQIGEIGLEDMSAATILEEITNPFNEKGLQGDEDL